MPVRACLSRMSEGAEEALLQTPVVSPSLGEYNSPLSFPPDTTPSTTPLLPTTIMCQTPSSYPGFPTDAFSSTPLTPFPLRNVSELSSAIKASPKMLPSNNWSCLDLWSGIPFPEVDTVTALAQPPSQSTIPQALPSQQTSSSLGIIEPNPAAHPSSPSPPAKVSLCLLNARSAVGHADELHDLIEELQPQLFFITETWFRSNNDPICMDLLPENYSILSTARQDRIGGGVAIIHKKSISLTQSRLTPEPTSFEYTLARGSPAGIPPITFLCIYRPPGKEDLFLEELQLILEDLFISAPRLILCGDLNFPYNKTLDPYVIRLRQLLEAQQCHQTSTEATHRLGNQLDLVTYRNVTLSALTSSVIPWADHRLLTASLPDWTTPVGKTHPQETKNSKRIWRRSFKNLTPSSFGEHWHSCTRTDLSTDDLDAIFNAKLGLVRNILCPLHLIREKPPIHIRNKWFSGELIRLRAECRRLQHTWRKSGSQSDHSRYLKHHKYYKIAIKQSKKHFVQSQITNSSNHSKALFKISATLLGKSLNDRFCPSDPLQHCATVADFFSQKVVDIRNRVDAAPPSAHLEFALETFQAWTTRADTSSVLSSAGPATTDTVSEPPSVPPLLEHFNPISPDELQRVLLKLGPSSSILDPFPTSIIRHLLPVLLPDLLNIVNSSLSSGRVPQAWKQGVVTPLPKKPNADQGNPSNLRPVSQLRLLPRITEAVITTQVQAHIEHHTLLHDLQSGFRPGRGTESATADMREKLLWCADRSHPVVLILLDLSAAFDTVDHTILLQRLQDIGGIQGTALTWFRAFLSDRSQAVRWDEVCSGFTPVPCGVPQGSSLSPILFNIYLRPLASLLEQSGLRFQMYADDVQILVDLHESAGERERLVPCLTLVEDWMRLNKLCLNSAKTELFFIGAREGGPVPTIPWPPSWGPQPPPVTRTRNLGVVFSHRLDGAAHAAATVTSCHHQLNSLARVFPCLNLAQKKQLYQAMVGSRISYGLLVMLGASKKTLFSLQKVQNRAIRMIFNLKRRDHISPWRLQLQWLTVQDQLALKTGTWLWKAINNVGPRYIHQWASRPLAARARRTCRRNLLAPPRFQKNRKGGVSITCKGARLWNSFPPSVRNAKSLGQFKSLAKQHLLNIEASRLGISAPPPPSSITCTPSFPPVVMSRGLSHPRTSNSSDFVFSSAQAASLPPAPPIRPIRWQVPTGISSPPLPARDNSALLSRALSNKAANRRPDGSYAPRQT